MNYLNLFIVCVITFVVILPNEINSQRQQPPQQQLQQRQPQQRPPQQRPLQRPQRRPQQRRTTRQQPQQPQQQPQQPQQQPQQSTQQPQQPQQQPQQPQQQCSPRGGNCQQNSDCCSTSCLVQRCQRSTAEIQQEIALGYTGSNVPFWDIPGGKQYNNIDDLLGSIYEDGSGTRISNNQPRVNNNRPVAVTNPNNFQQLSNNNRQGLNRNLPVSNNLGTRFGGNDDNSSAGQQTSATCGEIGAQCSRGLECCSSRCHGFLHKCVT